MDFLQVLLLAKQYPVDLPIQGHMFDRTIPKYLWKDFSEEVNESCSDADNIYVKVQSLSKFSGREFYFCLLLTHV